MKSNVIIANWLKEKEIIRNEVLLLPTDPKPKKMRKTVDVGGRILTLSLLNDIDLLSKDRKLAAKTKKESMERRKKSSAASENKKRKVTISV
jgi:hypothetical protein